MPLGGRAPSKELLFEGEDLLRLARELRVLFTQLGIGALQFAQLGLGGGQPLREIGERRVIVFGCRFCRRDLANWE